MSQSIAITLRYELVLGSGQVEFSTVSGQSTVSEIVVQRLEVLGQARDGFLMLCSAFAPEIPIDGILGLDFLRGQRLTLDFRTGLITLD
jgi:hypothetical protein